MELVHGKRSVNVQLEDGRTRLFRREDVKKDTTKRYQEAEEEELRSQAEFLNVTVIRLCDRAKFS